MAKRDEPRNDHPHHMHALAKGAAEHLHRMGHIDKDQHREIVAHAEKGMKAARKSYGGSKRD